MDGPRSRRRGRRLFESIATVKKESDGVYFTTMMLGSPTQQAFTVIVDTGSSTIAVPCKGCKCGPHAHFDAAKSVTERHVGSYNQCYGEGSCNRGVRYSDKMCFGDHCALNATAIDHAFGCCTVYAPAFQAQKADGIVGLSPAGQTLIASLVKRHKLDENKFALCLSASGGELTVGGVDKSLHRGSMAWLPYTGTSGYYIESVGLQVAGEVAVSTGHAVMVDSGTTYTFIPVHIHAALKRKFLEVCASDGMCMSSSGLNPQSALAADLRDSIACYEFGSNAEQRLRYFKSFPPITLLLKTVGNSEPHPFCVPPEAYFFESTSEAHCIGLFSDASFVMGANLMANWNMIFDLSSSKIGVVRATCDGKDEIPTLTGICWNGSFPNNGLETKAPQILYSWWIAALLLAIALVTAIICLCVALSSIGVDTSRTKYDIVIDDELEDQEGAPQEVQMVDIDGPVERQRDHHDARE